MEPIYTDRLILKPFTKEIIHSINEDRGRLLRERNLKYGIGWPDEDTWETLPKIEKNLDLVPKPTGFESWMIIKKEDLSIIGDAGFKGQPNSEGKIDLGYAIILVERRQGYALETAKGLIDWAFKQKNVTAVTAKCLLENLGSQKVLQNLQFQELKRDDEMIYWTKFKAEFISQQITL